MKAFLFTATCIFACYAHGSQPTTVEDLKAIFEPSLKAQLLAGIKNAESLKPVMPGHLEEISQQECLAIKEKIDSNYWQSPFLVEFSDIHGGSSTFHGLDYCGEIKHDIIIDPDLKEKTLFGKITRNNTYGVSIAYALQHQIKGQYQTMNETIYLDADYRAVEVLQLSDALVLDEAKVVTMTSVDLNGNLYRNYKDSEDQYVFHIFESSDHTLRAGRTQRPSRKDATKIVTVEDFDLKAKDWDDAQYTVIGPRIYKYGDRHDFWTSSLDQMTTVSYEGNVVCTDGFTKRQWLGTPIGEYFSCDQQW